MNKNVKWILAYILMQHLFYLPTAFSASNPDNIVKPTEALSTDCTEEDKPKVNQELSDVDLQVGQTKVISAAEAISGTKMYYTISALVTNPKNQVIINRRTGIVVIKANFEDEFPITVNATNPCGTTSLTFNVKINAQ
ncbi:Uncharacterised protein [Legionella busanensis]|uniref:BIG2 domain-containing protein n=1 Tax=Legionella busanensis TaxID=190655 RepID=A0A378JK95_9GAMM|nr:hypothetical protein [Legionella busanensis]STX50560.1 Uncharacterised protein [Legionella busanensis]